MAALLSLDERSVEIMRRDGREAMADSAGWKSSGSSHSNSVCVAIMRHEMTDLNTESQSHRKVCCFFL